MSNTDDDIVSPPFCFDQRSSAVETHVFSPFSVWLTLRSGHADHSPFHLLPLGLRNSFRAEPFLSRGFEIIERLNSDAADEADVFGQFLDVLITSQSWPGFGPRSKPA